MSLWCAWEMWGHYRLCLWGRILWNKVSRTACFLFSPLLHLCRKYVVFVFEHGNQFIYVRMPNEYTPAEKGHSVWFGVTGHCCLSYWFRGVWNAYSIWNSRSYTHVGEQVHWFVLFDCFSCHLLRSIFYLLQAHVFWHAFSDPTRSSRVLHLA